MHQKTQVTDHYNTVAGDYDREFYLDRDPYPPLRWRHEHMLELIDAASIPEGAKVLDIGCGPGEMVVDLARRGFDLWGVDISESMIDIARERVDSANDIETAVHLNTGDIERLTFQDGMFDLVVAAGVVEYLDSDGPWVRELNRVMKPGGMLLLNVTNRYTIRRLTAPLFDRLKALGAVRGSMDFIKRRILRRGSLNYFPFTPRTHVPRLFDRFLAAHGFTKTAHRYFAFSILPYPLDTLLGIITIPIRRRFERHARGKLGLIGTGYIVSARKTSTQTP